MAIRLQDVVGILRVSLMLESAFYWLLPIAALVVLAAPFRVGKDNPAAFIPFCEHYATWGGFILVAAVCWWGGYEVGYDEATKRAGADFSVDPFLGLWQWQFLAGAVVFATYLASLAVYYAYFVKHRL